MGNSYSFSPFTVLSQFITIRQTIVVGKLANDKSIDVGHNEVMALVYVNSGEMEWLSS